MRRPACEGKWGRLCVLVATSWTLGWRTSGEKEEECEKQQRGALTLGVANELPFGFGDASVENDRGNTDEIFRDDPGDWKPMFALRGNMKGMALSTSSSSMN